jgi:hypothetical protein
MDRRFIELEHTLSCNIDAVLLRKVRGHSEALQDTKVAELILQSFTLPIAEYDLMLVNIERCRYQVSTNA